ncbi:uncharacterized protein LOC112346365 isoform X2 [Selaginella moellendorffii]|uniref:uncharacterized protein LOC112346365 isoform X2 n=1 Tax=Selaginella moellendorffii TaxID=88036 RepID=UPI000D1CAA48|nr:uncharacterized protein LOC112346365 isoform X2 [Selaginella moellendorffii]|eukprot:XP_024530943.1 uncharacterized protein LOC112346365 isoform X2 [Selaginella moellendorffii]
MGSTTSTSKCCPCASFFCFARRLCVQFGPGMSSDASEGDCEKMDDVEVEGCSVDTGNATGAAYRNVLIVWSKESVSRIYKDAIQQRDAQEALDDCGLKCRKSLCSSTEVFVTFTPVTHTCSRLIAAIPACLKGLVSCVEQRLLETGACWP